LGAGAGGFGAGVIVRGVGGGASFAALFDVWLAFCWADAEARGGTPAARPATDGSLRRSLVDAEADALAGAPGSLAVVDGDALGADDGNALPAVRVVDDADRRSDDETPMTTAAVTPPIATTAVADIQTGLLSRTRKAPALPRSVARRDIGRFGHSP
jgi:hypothetical protein